MATPPHQRVMRRVPPDHPVRRCLFPEDADEARVDNLANLLQESIATERDQKSQRWNFDFANDVPLEGDIEWYRSDGRYDWIGAKIDTKLEDAKEEDSFLPKKTENEITPKSKDEESAPLLPKKRRQDVDSPNDKARRKISFD